MARLLVVQRNALFVGDFEHVVEHPVKLSCIVTLGVSCCSSNAVVKVDFYLFVKRKSGLLGLTTPTWTLVNPTVPTTLEENSLENHGAMD